MAFISLIFAFLFICIIGVIVLAAIILLLVGIHKLKKEKRLEQEYKRQMTQAPSGQIPYKRRIYPKVFITLGLMVLIPFTAIVTGIIVNYKMNLAKDRKNLFNCVVNEEFGYAQKLIDKGASPERVPDANVASNEAAAEGEETLLIHFCRRQGASEEDAWADVVEFLIKNGADVNRRTWIHEAGYAEHSGSAEDGYQHNDFCGETPIMAAAHAGNVKSVELLIENGADVNATDYCGRTALMYAARSYTGERGRKIVTILVEHGIDIDAEDNFGQTVWDYIVDYSRGDIREILVQAQKQQ